MLVASHCQLACLPDEVAMLPLNKLDISHNRLTTLPTQLCADVAALGELVVSHNQLRCGSVRHQQHSIHQSDTGIFPAA